MALCGTAWEAAGGHVDDRALRIRPTPTVNDRLRFARFYFRQKACQVGGSDDQGAIARVFRVA
jgi:hypothetical protein